jgi:hypothetical protein
MATKRIKDLTNTAASVASDAYLAIDGTSNGTEKITRDNFRQDTADAFVAAPGTYNLAPLSGGAVEVAKGGTGATTVAGARTNLEVNSIDEDAQANALKTTAPALYFDGSNDYVEVAHDAKQHFNDGTDDLPFSISAWVKMEDATNFVVISKFTAVSGGEWMFNCEGDDLRLYLQTSSGNSVKRLSASAITSYEGEWVHLAATYAGTSGGVFSSAGDGITLHVNGQPVAMDAAFEDGTYAGMANGTQAVRIGSQQSVFSKGHIRDVKIFNRELTDDEVAELARGNDLGFADEWGGATATSGTLTVGKRYRLRDWITGDDFTNVGAASNADGVEFIATGTTPTTWSNSSVVESIGTLADFRAERYDTSTSKLYDLSDNAFVGTGTSISITGREVPVYETGEYTPTFSFSGSATGLAYGSQYGRYTRIGNICHVTGGINLTAKGSDSGNPRITLPFTAFVEDGSNSVQGGSITYASDWATLSSPLTPWIVSGSNYFLVYDWGATGVTAVNQTNVTDTTNIRWSITYRIQ